MAAEKMSEVRHSILTRCSTRSFTAEPVPDELLTQLIDAGLAAPWAYHDHARHLCAISGHENVQILARVFSEVLGRPGYNMYRPAAAPAPSAATTTKSWRSAACWRTSSSRPGTWVSAPAG